MPVKKYDQVSERYSKRRRMPKGKGLSKKQKMQVQKLIEDEPEKKFFDHEFNFVELSRLPAFIHVSNVPPGIESSQRIGVEIKLQSIQWNLYFESVNTYDIYRFMVIQWFNDSSNDLPQWEQIFQYGLAGSLNKVQVQSPLIINQGNQSCFKILHSEDLHSDADDRIYRSKGFINKGFKKTLGLNQNEDITVSRGPNHIYFMLVSDGDLVTQTKPTVHGYSRIRFTDS